MDTELKPAPAPPTCRTDGRCQYAIDLGAEGHCPPGKFVLPDPAAATISEMLASGNI